MLLRLNCHVVNLSASLEISLPYQAVYYYLLDNPVSGPSFVPTVIAALHPSNINNAELVEGSRRAGGPDENLVLTYSNTQYNNDLI